MGQLKLPEGAEAGFHVIDTEGTMGTNARLRSLLAVTVLCLLLEAGYLPMPKAPPPPLPIESVATIARFVGRPPERQTKGMLSLMTAIDRLEGRPRDLDSRLLPRYVWRWEQGPAASYLVMEANLIVFHPGTTHVRVFLVERSGVVRAQTWLVTGWRCYLRQARLRPGAAGELPLLVLDTGPGSGPGPEIAKQYYALVEGRFELVRLEGHEGVAVRNEYYVKHFRSGPAPRTQPDEQWEADLCGPDRARALRAVVWLGGTHRLLRKGDPEGQQWEGERDVRQVNRVRSRPKVIERLQELAARGDRWEREGAKLALSPEDTSW